MPDALLTQEKNRVRNRSESRYWDYKRELILDDPIATAEFAKDVAAFTNADGGVIIVGVSDQYAANGVPDSTILDRKRIHDKIRRYLGQSIEVFQDSIEVPNKRVIWLIFVPKYKEAPQSMIADGPYKSGKPVFSRGQYFYREGDEVKLCRSDNDVEKLFRGISSEHLSAYNYEIDEPFFRLLNSNCEKFVGRTKKIDEIRASLDLRQPVVALDGLGGVGKTALAIEVVRQLHLENKYLFIVSVSAKTRVWVGHVKPRRAAFAGLHSLLLEISTVIPYIDETDDTEELKRSIVSFMKGQPGLILVDNLEEIEDDNVLKFLSQEVPEPVKVLITSRIGKNLGALTVSVPGMTDDEARDLLRSELERLACVAEEADAVYIDAIIAASGGVPLAVKWAAQIASERGSLREASSTLRGAGSDKLELLSFCFTTMYDALSDAAKDVARLIPYLGTEWKPMTISIALGISVDAVRIAIFELSDKGIIFPVLNGRHDEHGVLPLTKEFLSNKWHQSHLQRGVDRRFSETFSAGSEGFLLEWPVKRRVEFLTKLASEKCRSNDYSDALQLVRLAQSWLIEIDGTQFAVALRFLEGQALYSTENRAAGLAHMRHAITSHKNDKSLEADDVVFYAQSLFAHGGNASEKEASEATLLGLQQGGEVSADHLSRFIDCNIRRGDNRLIAETVSWLRDGNLICAAFDQIAGLLRSPQVAHTYEKEWSTALGHLSACEKTRSEKKKHYLLEFGQIRERPLKR